MPLLLPPQYQNERNAARRGSSDATTFTAKTITPPVTSTETCMEIESSYMPALKSGCNIPLPFICYPRL